MLPVMTIKEAIHSVALEHEPSCRCDVCLACEGDEGAWARVMMAFYESVERNRRRTG